MIASFFRRRRDAYRAVFTPADGKLSPVAELVLADLRAFCYADKPTPAAALTSAGTIDPLRMAIAEGRREVWLRIREHLGKEADKYLERLEEAERRHREPLDGS